MVTDLAIDIGNKLEALKEICKEKKGSSGIDGYVRRAEDFPSLMLQAGLVAATTFYLSKANLDSMDKYYIYWKTGNIPEVDTGNNEGKKERFDVCSDLSESTSKGYSAYAASLFYIFGSVFGDCKSDNLKPSDVLKCLNLLERDELKYERTLAPILIRVKEISNILSPESKEEGS
jgi:CRISPR type III-B/RAMP module-associated protein Cmr5